MTFLKCTIRGEKHGETAFEELPMEQEVATGKISRATSPNPHNAEGTPGQPEDSDRQVINVHVH